MVGGTKEVNWDICASLSPDLVVFDREENTAPMADSCPYPWHATHVTSVSDVGGAFILLGEVLGNDKVVALGEDWNRLSREPVAPFPGWDRVPGLIHSLGLPPASVDRIEYMIWKDPWMAVGRQTFIGSMLSRVGLGGLMKRHEKPYPELDPSDLPAANTFYLFSSEPFPFERYAEELEESGFNGALVDGEFYSWFGLRSFRLLDAYLKSRP